MKFNIIKRLFFIIALFPFLGGCTVTPYTTTDDISRIEERDIADMGNNNITSDEMRDEINNNRIEMLDEIEGIRSSIKRMEKRIEEIEGRKGGEVEERKVDKVGALQPEVPTLFMPNMMDKNEKNEKEAKKVKKAKKANKVLTTNLDSSKMDPNKLYQLAYNDFKLKEYDNAIKRFREFLGYYKESDLADNALYWIGESYYAKGDYKVALSEFKKVIDEYPNGNKSPDALFKYGMSFYELNDQDSALRELRRVIKLYPDSEIIGMVRKKIEMIEGNKNKD